MIAKGQYYQWFAELAPRHGFEPRFTAPKAAVLPLDDRGSRRSGTDQLSDFITRVPDSRIASGVASRFAALFIGDETSPCTPSPRRRLRIRRSFQADFVR